MQFLLGFFLSSFLLGSCAGNKNQTSLAAANIIEKDTAVYTVIKYDSEKQADVPREMSPAFLSEEEIKEIDGMVRKAVLEHNMVVRGEQLYIDDLSKYKFQLVPYLNKNGEKHVWVNAFCSNDADWKTRIVSVDDGGKCYFNLTINLSLKAAFGFQVNGVG